LHDAKPRELAAAAAVAGNIKPSIVAALEDKAGGALAALTILDSR